MSSFWIVVFLIASGLVWLPVLWNIPARSVGVSAQEGDADLPCTLCGRPALSRDLYTWRQWHKDVYAYRFGCVCQGCVQHWHARPAQEVWNRDTVHS